MHQLKEYEKFLFILDGTLHTIFEREKEYLCCKEGCSLCCEQGEYPVSDLEFEYLMYGFKTLDADLQKKINKTIEEIKNSDERLHRCPFLVDKKCALYKYRPLICRTFGVISENKYGKLTIPFCRKEGLNYSKVFDTERKMISSELVAKYNYSKEPTAYNLNNENIMNLDIARDLNLSFGEIRKMKDQL